MNTFCDDFPEIMVDSEQNMILKEHIEIAESLFFKLSSAYESKMSSAPLPNFDKLSSKVLRDHKAIP
jgi:hypothetical protein